MAPAGLSSLPTTGVAGTGTQHVTFPTGGFTNLDPFVDAQTLVQNVGGDVTAWVMIPGTLQALRKLKTASGWNTTLLQTNGRPDPQVAPNSTNGLTIDGVPVYVTPYGLADNVIWGVDADRILIGVRDEVRLDIDTSVLFTSDRVAVRAIMRVGWVFPEPEALVVIS